MSATLAASLAKTSVATPVALASRSSRDLRLDFFRGIALLLIFIDHVSGNRFAALTLQSMGFADAAEVFVFIAGMSAVYAYRSRFARGFTWEGTRTILARVRLLYLAHLGMLVGVIGFAALATSAGTGFDVIGKLGLQPLFADPVQALMRAAVLGYLPHYLDILPLYVLLLGALPFILAGLRRHPALPFAIAALVYLLAHGLALNLPNFGHEGGWFLNPFTWLLIFTAGATTADAVRRGAFARLPRPFTLLITMLACTYVVFAFLHAAPWRVFPELQPFTALSFTVEADKAFASWPRLVDIAAKIWLVAVFIPATATFMAQGLGGAISRAGRNSLPLFISGTFLSLIGSIILYEANGHPLAHIGVTAGGVILMLMQAAWIEYRGRQSSNETAQLA